MLYVVAVVQCNIALIWGAYKLSEDFVTPELE
jgi:hypothetical protein